MSRPEARLRKVPLSPLVILARAQWYPLWGTHFAEADFLASLAAAAPFTRVVAFRVPAGDLGILEGFANGVANLTDWDNLTWQVRLNGTAIPMLQSIQGPLGVMPDPIELSIPLRGGHLIEVMVRNNSGVAITNPTALILGRTFAPDLPDLFLE